MCMVGMEGAVCTGEAEVILSWETNGPYVLSSEGYLGGRTFSARTGTVPATHPGLIPDGVLGPGHTQTSFPSPHVGQAHPKADLLQQEENTHKIS